MVKLPPILAPYADRKVRAVAAYGEAELNALIGVASHGRKDWTPADWGAYYYEAMRCDDTVAQFAARKDVEDLL
jgi:hypothetical protein